MNLWKVAVSAPLFEPLTYAFDPQEIDADQLHGGVSVRVPLGRRLVSGVLLEKTEATGDFALKNISQIVASRPLIPARYIAWLNWLSKYYLHPIGQVLDLCFPPLDKKDKVRARKKTPPGAVSKEIARPNLTPQQKKVLQDIPLDKGFAVHLVHGVTGSGKTEVYMQLMEQIIAKGEQGLVLVPEISLTPQLIDRFAGRLGSSVAVMHSQLTPREKTEQWWSMLDGSKQILIGARSALFCPLTKLGLVIVDEEHETSFKQDEKLKYHARDAAVMLGKFMNCPVVLGSATPSLESWQNALEGRYQLHQLKDRVENRLLPDVQVVDLRDEREERKLNGQKKPSELPFWLSEELFAAIKTTLENSEQAALFLNRRGVAQSVVCPACGFVPECPNCAVSLTLHGRSDLLCHYCDYHQSLKGRCPDCKEGEPKPIGIGTELIESDLKKLFPSARITRMDRDEITTREDLEAAIHAVEARETDLLVGTQMIAKGLDFPGLTLVGLVLADVAFNLPDFRASERSFQLLTQVAGRSGRHLTGGRAGKVIVQTYNPEHPSLIATVAHDFIGFAHKELEFRRLLGYPPFGKVAAFRIQSMHLEKAESASHLLRKRAEQLKAKYPNFSELEILGPAEAPLARLRNQFRFQLLLKSPTASLLGSFAQALWTDLDSWLPAQVKIKVDIDAIHML